MMQYPANSVQPIVEYMINGGGGGNSLGDTAQLVDEYRSYCMRHFETISPWLLPKATTITDIGPGVGGIDVLICNSRDIGVLHIVEGDGDGKRRHGFHPYTKAWADRSIALDFIKANVKCSVFGHDPDPDLTLGSNLIISLKSWGHHYPISTYLGFAQRSLRLGGRIIMDIRNHRGGLAEMQAGGFRCIGKADYDSPKCERLIFERARTHVRA